MTYSQGGLIQATDYNSTLAGANPTNVAGTINRVWGVGYSDSGYGQTAVSQIAVGNTVTAAQWASLINAVNNARKHQAGGGYTNLGVPVAGDTINWLNTLQSRITDAYTNRLSNPGVHSYYTTLQKSFSLVAGAGVAADGNVIFSIEFQDVDKARYFFNTGGYLAVGYTSVTNNNGTARSGSIVTLYDTNWVQRVLLAQTSYKTGSGGSVSANYTYGYYGITQNVYNNLDLIYSSGTYSSDFVQFNINAIGGTGSNGANGHTIYLQVRAYSGTTGSGEGYDDNVNVTLSPTCYVGQITSSYITPAFGTVTVT